MSSPRGSSLRASPCSRWATSRYPWDHRIDQIPDEPLRATTVRGEVPTFSGCRARHRRSSCPPSVRDDRRQDERAAARSLGAAHRGIQSLSCGFALPVLLDGLDQVVLQVQHLVSPSFLRLSNNLIVAQESSVRIGSSSPYRVDSSPYWIESVSATNVRDRRAEAVRHHHRRDDADRLTNTVSPTSGSPSIDSPPTRHPERRFVHTGDEPHVAIAAAVVADSNVQKQLTDVVTGLRVVRCRLELAATS